MPSAAIQDLSCPKTVAGAGAGAGHVAATYQLRIELSVLLFFPLLFSAHKSCRNVVIYVFLLIPPTFYIFINIFMLNFYTCKFLAIVSICMCV